jgi:activator of HSP90 ATPase
MPQTSSINFPHFFTSIVTLKNQSLYSIIKFELTPIADHQTRLTFDQCGYPQEHQDHLATGWQDRYWTPIEQYLKR